MQPEHYHTICNRLNAGTVGVVQCSANQWTEICMRSCKTVIFGSAEAVVSLLGFLKIVTSLRAHHYHLFPHWLAELLPAPPFPFPASRGPLDSPLRFPDILFIHPLQNYVSCLTFYYWSGSKQMFLKSDQSIRQRVEKTSWASEPVQHASVWVTYLCIKPGDGERAMRMSMTVMTASKYEINHSPVHLIISCAATNLWEGVIYFLFSLLRLSWFQSGVYITE